MAQLSHQLSLMCQLLTELLLSINANTTKFPLHVSPSAVWSWPGVVCTMAKLYSLSLFLSFLYLSYVCIGQQPQCQIQNFNPEKPRFQVQAEGGVTESWDRYSDQFQCAGVQMVRHIIRQEGLLLPFYSSSNLLYYVEQGRGFFGIMIPGCPETFQSSQVQFDRRRRFFDQHQKIQHFRKGDILAFPAGSAHWVYNNGDQPLVLVLLQDVSNNINQLDQISRRFFIAGTRERTQPKGQQGQQEQQGQQSSQGRRKGNVLRGIPTETLAEIFKVDIETAKKLQGEDDERGHIIRVEKLQVLSPPLKERKQQEGQQEKEFGGSQNGLEETICSARVRQNIDNPSRPDVYNPEGGHFTAVNSFTFPILALLQLSAERGVLYANAIMSPHWYINSHCVMYATSGDARVQMVDSRGQTVLDDQLRRGQAVVVPMGYAVVIKAGNQGFEWVAFNTNDNAMINTLAGRASTLSGLPASVLAIAYQTSEEQALKLKYSRQDTMIFSPGSSSETVASE